MSKNSFLDPVMPHGDFSQSGDLPVMIATPG